MSIKLLQNIQFIEVKLSGEKVGRIALTPDRNCAFEYDTEYLRNGISISPFYLPLQSGVFVAKRDPFSGNFGVKRFDRQFNGKQHVISAAGLLNADYRIPCLDYSTLMTACFRLTRNMEELYKLFRLMIFNVLIKNKDDHAKNFSFILINKSWQLSPAYDLLPGGGFNGFHTTTVHGQGSPTRKDIMEVANQAGLNKRRANDIFEEIYQKTNNLI